MVTAFVQHRVKDYDAWRQVYDSVVDMQKAGGVITESVYRSESDSNLVMPCDRMGVSGVKSLTAISPNSYEKESSHLITCCA